MYGHTRGGEGACMDTHVVVRYMYGHTLGVRYMYGHTHSGEVHVWTHMW